MSYFHAIIITWSLFAIYTLQKPAQAGFPVLLCMSVSTVTDLCTLQAAPCLLLAFIAKPGTQHKLIFRVSHVATASLQY